MPARVICATFRRWRARRRRKAAIRDLRALDNRTLKDMGLTRGEIVAAVDGEVYRGAPARPDEPGPRPRRTADAAPAATIEAAALQGHLAHARRVRAEHIAGLCGGLGSTLRRLRCTAAALLRRKATLCPSPRQLMPPPAAAGGDRGHPVEESRHGGRSHRAA